MWQLVSWAQQILLPVILLCAVGGNAQMVQCYVFERNCGGLDLMFPLSLCRGSGNGLSYRDPPFAGECVNFPIIFGFEQTSLEGVERGDEYSVNMGFLEGLLDQDVDVQVEIILEGSTRSSDLNLVTSGRVFQALSSMIQPVTFQLLADFIAQEVTETFRLRLNYDKSLFQPNDNVIFFDELSVTILDGDDARLRFSEDDYFASEGTDPAMPVRIIKDTNVRLANPVTFRVTPLTVEKAIDLEIIADDRFPENYRSPLRADENDFDTTIFNVAFSADEDLDSPITIVNAPIPINDDDIDEAEEQSFIILLEVTNATDIDTLIIDRSVSTGIIQDNEIVRIGFPRQVYTYFEPPFTFPFFNVTLVKDDNQVSEQTFRVGITASDAPGITPATLETATDTTWDYRIGIPGQTFILREFPPNVQEIYHVIFLNSDDIPEGLEGFMLTSSVGSSEFPFFYPPLTDSTTAFPSTRIEIVDDDMARVGWETTSYMIHEADGSGEACLQVFDPPNDVPLNFNIILQYEPVSGTADMNDYLPGTQQQPTILASPASENPRRTCMSFPITQDGVSEETESFIVNLTFLEPEVVIDPPVTEIFILDDDDAVVSFINAPSLYQVNESSNMATIEVGVINSLQRTVSVLITFSDDSAMNGSDYSIGASELLTFGPLNDLSTISIPIINDNTFERAETFKARLQLPDEPQERVTFELEEITVEILDDDELVFGFVKNTYEVVEKAREAVPSVALIDGDPGDFNVTLIAGVDEEFEQATALAGLDFKCLPRRELAFSSSNTMRSFSIDIMEDGLTELSEIFATFVRLNIQGDCNSLETHESRRIKFERNRTQIVILDSDSATLGFNIPPVTLAEDTSMDICVVVMNGTLGRDVTLNLTTSIVSTTTVPETLTVKSGKDRECFKLRPPKDTILEKDEVFDIILMTDVTAITLDPNSINITVEDASMVTIGFPVMEYNVTEGMAVTVCVELREGNLARNTTVVMMLLSATGAIASSTPEMMTLTFNATHTEHCVDLNTTEDLQLEDPKSFTVTLDSREPNDKIFLNPSETTVNIMEDDNLVINVEDMVRVVEGSEAVIHLNISETAHSLNRDISILVVTMSLSATEDTDFDGINTTITFAPPDHMVTIVINTTCDSSTRNDPKTFRVDFSITDSTLDGLVILNPSSSNVTITDYSTSEDFPSLYVKIQGDMGQLVVAFNKSATLTCVVKSVPGPSFIQLTAFMNETRQILDEKSIASGDRCQEQHTLETVVGPVSLEETGTVYKCVSGNNIVNDTDNITLVVQDLPTATDEMIEDAQAATLSVSDIVIIAVVSVLVVVILLVLIVIIIVVMKIRSKKFTRIDLDQKISSGLSDDFATTSMKVRKTLRVKVPRHLIINSSDLQLVESVGQGEYGIVYRAKLSRGFSKSLTEIVAVKTLKGFMDDTLVKGLLQECSKMSTFDHPNVLAVSGVCVDGGPAPYIIMPFMFNGSLLSYLKKKREELVLSSDLGAETLAVSAKLTNICFQVAKGMEYLSSCKVVHRDLAARNCMIDLNFVVKVADFGLSETIDPSKDYFRQDSTEGVKLPVKWLAPECLSDGIFSEKTDVWAFGVTCWEVFSGGKMPYSGINPADLPHMLEAGYRMEKPSNWACQDEIYDTMMQCWASKAENRPTFSVLVTSLSEYLESLSGYTPLLLEEKSSSV